LLLIFKVTLIVDHDKNPNLAFRPNTIDVVHKLVYRRMDFTEVSKTSRISLFVEITTYLLYCGALKF